MYTPSDLRKGLKIELDGYPYVITEFDFYKPGKGQALYRCKMRNMITGSTTDKTFRSVDKIDTPDLTEREMVFSHAEGDHFVFMDGETYEQIIISGDVIGQNQYFLKDGIVCEVLFFRDKPIEITLPYFIEAVIARTEPGARGDTATNVTKPAFIENGYEIAVPLFVNEGDLVKIDTRTGQYSERVSKKA
ncbi:MAG: Elongation factor P [Lentisphaerae bacterium ADurb.BinA184]|nr:MAG: Elongation factor P [Lentisphaerae bacterium ADurb.BinA184]